MLKRILTLTIIITLHAGFYLFPVEANNDKLQRILQITGLPAERTDEIGGKFVTLKARLDRDMLVYGLPNDIPNNDWKTEADGVITSWQEANGIDLGHPGKQEPRYLGKTADWEDLASDYFPDDAPNQVAPARRDMMLRPWTKGLSYGPGLDIFDYAWGVIVKALSSYHERVGYPGPGNGFASNPAFQDKFNKDILKDYFLIMAEPKPGLAGAVRQWHNRHDLGGIWYDPIFIRWDVLPNFIMESIDPGTDKAKPGETYVGKVVLKAVPDASFMSDPVTNQLFEAAGEKLELAQDYTVPFDVAVNGRLVPVKSLKPVAGLDNVYQYSVPAGAIENRIEFSFQWTAPANPADGKITLAAGVNTIQEVLPENTWSLMDWSEITSSDNAKVIEVPTDVPNLLVTGIELTPDQGLPGQETSGNIKVLNKSDIVFKNVLTIWKVRKAGGSTFNDGQIYCDLAPGESKALPFNFTPDVGGLYSVAAMINPGHDNPPDEINYLNGDWPGDNRQEVAYPVELPCTNISVSMSKEGEPVAGHGITLYVHVRRANDGPAGPVDVSIRLTGPGTNRTKTISLERGESGIVKLGVQQLAEGVNTFTVSVWPVGLEDCAPGNNEVSLSVNDQALRDYTPTESKIESWLVH